MLLSGRLGRDQRQGAGWALVIVGAFTTLPIALSLIGRQHSAEERLVLAS